MTFVFDTPEEYHAKKAVSNSGIKKILDCPARFKAWLDGEKEVETEAMLHGSVFHCLVLEPERFTSRYLVQKHKGNTAKGKLEKKHATEQGKALITEKIYESSLTMAEALKNHDYVGKLLQKHGKREGSIYWDEFVADVRIPCKMRLDHLVELNGLTIAVDYKSTASSSPKDLEKAIYDYGYYIQNSWYKRGLRHAEIEIDAFVFPFIEKTAPYIVTPVTLSLQAVEYGDTLCNHALALYADAINTGKWTCYTDKIMEIDLPLWGKRKIENEYGHSN